MNTSTKTIFIATMTAALFFGFLHLFVPGHNFERLHIFLFNLTGGGTIILMYTEERKSFSAGTAAFFMLSLLYAIAAFLRYYAFAAAIAVVLALVVEAIRVKRFAFSPADFFRGLASVQSKFHQAALLCLSLGLFISALVILNHEYWKILSSPKLTLDVFFLGFSFPVSLITMSVMFGMIQENGRLLVRILKNISFWVVNLGVIIFFVFILLEMLYAELAAAGALFIIVIVIFILYVRLGIQIQPKAFLTSGMSFLIMTAITGIIYILMHVFIPQPAGGKLLLKLHALISLYGWNLNGLAVICRNDDFPIKLHSGRVILFHWIIVTVIAPLGFYFRPMSVAAVMMYGAFLYVILFTRSSS
ncbi:MAG: hypothetical protein A2176_10575 [Spirochaetes bacterium RBG_13_51_14]|nr:MAG: hypothetical protein A2176_10575 [Spirochaetes bacterium RBG_13_51_14]